eukprot:GHVH01002460.1.p1 GENE.GHVH01002460.1~~GHVH01002460.1.p1  ORF type:complete len:381 (+),score=39.61 GHVH01002460.1:980-2122(+)
MASSPPTNIVPAIAQASVHVASVEIDTSQLGYPTTSVSGFDFESVSDDDRRCLKNFAASYARTGFQSTELGRAIEIVNEMRSWRLSDEAVTDNDRDTEYEEPLYRENYKCFTWLSFTSNLISSGLRDNFVYLAKHRLIDCIVTSAGGIEEDIIKCLGDTVLGEYVLNSTMMRSKGWNRIGNLIVPNKNYVMFEEWLTPILAEMTKDKGCNWTPSKMIKLMGQRINDESSLLYWAAKNDIPVFCPALTDGAIGDQLYFHSYNHDLKLDIIEDIRRINDLACHVRKSGAIILGGGVSKHQICNANLMRNGLDYAVYINTAQEFDGSDSGGNVEEAVTWGKIRGDAKKVKVVAEATLVFPLLMAATFASERSPEEPRQQKMSD